MKKKLFFISSLLCLMVQGTWAQTYIERSWDDTDKKVVNTEKTLTTSIAYDAEPTSEGQYKLVTNAPASSPNEWFGMGGYSTSVPEFYVVSGNVKRETIVVQGNDVHLILCDNATLTLTGGLKLEGDNKLYIHCQSYGDNMGRLMVTNKYKYAAGIGSARDVEKDIDKTVGELVIYGGHIEATGGQHGAGIGACARKNRSTEKLCSKIIIYGGYVKATSGEYAAGIGSGHNCHNGREEGGDFIMYDGTVIAHGESTGVGAGDGTPSFGHNVTVYGGSLTAIGDNSAGIGGSHSSDYYEYGGKLTGGTFTIYGGKVEATGGDKGAGIGGGYEAGGGVVKIHGGTVIAHGSEYAAGIGGGTYGFGGEVTITGGTVITTGGEKGAGIGGGSHGWGGKVTISGGTVEATGGEKAAGIGGGCYCSGGKVTITGGTVTATGGEKAAGIGGGYDAGAADVTITGGTIIAVAGNQGGTGNRAIGPGYGKDVYETLAISDEMMVGAGNNGSVERIYDADERKNACWYRSYAEISPCTHPSGLTFTINEDGTHNTHCRHCTVSEKVDHFNSDGNGTCICGYEGSGSYYTITIATSSNGTSYEGVGVMANVGKDKPFTLPVCSSIPEGYDFAGWSASPVYHDGILPTAYETLYKAGEKFTVNANINFFARYRALEISLTDDSDNSETLNTYNGRKTASVTLAGRTLTKNNEWNTLCLPFSLESFKGTPLEGATVKEMDNSETGTNLSADGVLTLKFKNVTSIEAGKPYIVKWTSGENISNPVFKGVTITSTTTTDVTTYDGKVTFVGQYMPFIIDEDNKEEILFVSSGNKIGYVNESATLPRILKNFRAHFWAQPNQESGAASARAITILFEDDMGVTTGLNQVTSDKSQVQSKEWYTIDGRKLNGMPKKKGVYIQNGQKAVLNN